MLKLWILSVSLLLLAAWLFSFCTRPEMPPIYNYDYSEFFDPQKVKLPTTEDEVVQIVKAASIDGHQVRVLGAGHSRNSLAYSKDILISLIHYRGIVNLDRNSQQVTVRAGTTLAELVDHLDQNGFVLGVLPAILEQTMAGAISTATHGCRTEYGNMATLVTKLKLVSGEGKVLSLTASDTNTDFFKAAQVSLGLLGVITEVTFQFEPSFKLEEIMEKRTLNSCIADLDIIAHSAESVKLWMNAYAGTCDVYRYDRTDEDIQTAGETKWINFKMYLWEPFLWLASKIPPIAPFIIRNSLLHGRIFYPEYTQVGKSFEIITAPLYVPLNAQNEIAVDIKHCASAIEVVNRELEEWKLSSIFTEIRFVGSDDIWMSMDYQRDSCHITTIIYNPSEEDKAGYFNSVFQILLEKDLKPRLHFGKYINLDLEELINLYPRMSDFKEVRSMLDPKGIFLNKMLEESFK